MRLEVLNKFNYIKQGDTKSKFIFKLLDYEDQPIDLTNKTVLVVIADSFTKILEKEPTIRVDAPGTIELSFDEEDITGYGDRRLEVHVIDSDGKKIIIPSKGYYQFVIEKNLEDISEGVTVVTLKHFENRFESRVLQMESVINDVQNTKFAADNAAERANDAADNADKATQQATNAAESATTQGQYAKEQGDYAKTMADEVIVAKESAEEAADNANTAADNANTATSAANQATAAANEARANANIAADRANQAADTASTAAENADNKAEELEQRVDEAIAAGTEDLEVKDARGGHANLRARLDAIDSQLAQKANKSELDKTNKRLDLLSSQVLGTYYDEELGEYVNLGAFWNLLRAGKKYTVEFTKHDVSPSPNGTKLDDNEGLVCEPSTNTYKGRNDYENIGLFMSIDVNAYVDENDDYHVTAIKGDGRFKADGSNGDVYVMSMPGYIKRYSDDYVWGISYADVMFPGYQIIDEAVKPDGTIRPFLLHAKYVAGRNPVDGHLASISGVAPEYSSMSHNGQITKFKEKGIQYSGKTSHDDFYTQMMFWLKYATTHSQAVMSGCSSYNHQYVNLVPETGVKRVILTNSEANNLVVGSTVSIGDYEGSKKTTDRNSALNRNIANMVNITDIVDLGNGNSAIYVDVEEPFDTTLTTTITTYPWNTGGCDNVLGQDGSPTDPTSGKEPFIINGIEMMVGGYENLQNLIINNVIDGDEYHVEVYANYDCHTYATSITEAYDKVGELVQTNNSWSYITEIEIRDNHPSVMLPVKVGGSSTTGFADGVYTNAPTNGTRQWRSLGYLSSGGHAGLRCMNAASGLSHSGWDILGRLSATGRSRRRAGVN